MNRFFLLLCLLWSGVSLSQGFPRGCISQDHAFSNYNLLINETGGQRLFLIYNHSTALIELERQSTPDAFMSPSLSVQLGAGFWSAFASDITGLVFECHVKEGDNVRRVDCHDALSVCEYPHVKFALSNMGNYWVSANKPQREILEDAAAKGIYLKW